MKKFLFLVVSLLFCGVSCRPPASEEDTRLVAATTTMVADLVRQIAGDTVEVEALMGAGVDPHLYKASPADGAKMNRAKVIFYNGWLLEGKMTDLFDRLSREGKRVHAVADVLPEDSRLEPPDSDGHPDPHIWGDASLWAQTIDAVVEVLVEIFPEEAEGFRERGEAYKTELAELHQWATERLAAIPAGSRKLVTSHDAFAYFGRAYDLEVVGVQGISTASEPSVADHTRMVDFIRQHQISAIFVESSVNPTLIEQISRDAGVKIGGELFSDAMGEPGEMKTADGESYDVGTYVGMLKHNVNTIAAALK